MQVKIEQSSYTIWINGKPFNRFEKTGQWNGIVEYRNPDNGYTIIIDQTPADQPDKWRLIKATPMILDKAGARPWDDNLPPALISRLRAKTQELRNLANITATPLAAAKAYQDAANEIEATLNSYEGKPGLVDASVIPDGEEDR